MKDNLDRTHDPVLTSWVESANHPGTDFPIQNLPFGVFRPPGTDLPARIGVAIGDHVLDLAACRKEGLLSSIARETAEASTQIALNGLMGLPALHRGELRNALSAILSSGSPMRERAARLLVPMAKAEMLLPAIIGDYTDFYASIHHATHVGGMFRPDNPLLPNYKYVPIGYHGRASSVVVSGTPVRRPSGQTKEDNAERPAFGPTRNLDYELEVGCFVASGNALGSAIPIDVAEEHVFGLCLLNDWSARDIQKWEYQPLGPFLAKNFATTISPWIVTMEALEPFRVPAVSRPPSDPQPLAYLFSPQDAARGGINLVLEVFLRTRNMRKAGQSAFRVSRGNFSDMYWSFAQMLAHHASNGCNLRSGDLLGSGTVSGRERESCGCLLEMTRRGSEPLILPNGETRAFLQDGDEVTLQGFCEHAGTRRIGFGECTGTIMPP